MRDPLSRNFSSLQSPSQDSWFQRVRGNFRQLLTPSRIFPSSANGAPIHFLNWEKSRRASRAQSVSLLTHTLIILALAVVAFRPPIEKYKSGPSGQNTPSLFPLPANFLDSLRGHRPTDGRGSSSGHDTRPTTQGNLPPRSSIQLLKPTLPENRHPELPIPPTILDASAPRVLTAVDNIGLPWMTEQNNSSGRGRNQGIGENPGDSIGDTPGDGVGRGPTAGFYHPGTTSPTCAYCPDPQYTDEAREAKLQGKMTLQVLVGADGRALQIRVVQGIGLGLDERAAQAIRGWNSCRPMIRHAARFRHGSPSKRFSGFSRRPPGMGVASSPATKSPIRRPVCVKRGACLSWRWLQRSA
jgi:protein TonB